MKDLLLRHYELIKQRGLITPETTVDQFMMKLYEEHQEVTNVYADDVKYESTPSSEFFHELTDLVLVAIHCMQHYGVDFRDELLKNIKIQENRVKNVKK